MALTPEQIAAIVAAAGATGAGQPKKDKKFDSLNPIGLALDILDTPRSLIVSGAKETIDAFQGEGFSLGDFASQYREGYGTGDLLRDETDGKGTGNKWIDRGIGFVGDVLLDPLTYVGAPGASALAKGGAKAAAGVTAKQTTQKALQLGANRGDDAARALADEWTSVANKLDEATEVARPKLEGQLRDIESRAASLDGFSSWQDDINQGIFDLGRQGGGGAAIKSGDVAEVLLGDKTSGLRLRPFWKDSGGAQLVSQESWERLTRLTRSARGSVSGSGAGRWVAGKFKGPLTTATRELFNEVGKTDTATAAKILAFGQDAPRVASQVQRQADNFLNDLAGVENAIGKNQTQRTALRTIVETPDDELGTVTREIATLDKAGLSEQVVRVRSFFKTVKQWAADNGVESGDLFDTYVPIRMTKDALKAVGSSGQMGKLSTFMRKRGITQTFMGDEVPVVTRGLAEGKLVAAADGTITASEAFNWAQWRKEIESIMSRRLGDDWSKVIEGDPIELMRRYLNEVTARVRVQQIQKAAVDNGIGVWLTKFEAALDLDKLAQQAGRYGTELEKQARRLSELAEREQDLQERLAARGVNATADVDLEEEAALLAAETSKSVDAINAIAANLKKTGSVKAAQVAERISDVVATFDSTGRVNDAQAGAVTTRLDALADGAIPTRRPDAAASSAAWYGDMAAGAQQRAAQLKPEVLATARAERDAIAPRIQSVTDEIAQIASDRDTEVAAILERSNRLNTQVQKIDARISRLQGQIEKAAGTDKVPTLQEQLAQALTKRAELNDQIGGRVGSKRRGIDKELKNVRQNAARKIARREALKAELGADLVDARVTADAVARTQRSVNPKLETLRAQRAVARDGSQTSRMLDEQIELLDTAAKTLEVRDRVVASLAADASPRMREALNVLAMSDAAQADLVKLAGTRNAIWGATRSHAEATAGLDAVLAATKTASETKEMVDELTAVLGAQLREFQSVMVPEQIAEALALMTKFQDLPDFVKFLDRFNGWWKGMATLSPGFHTRNYYSGMWANWLAGVPVESQIRFGREYRRWVFGKSTRDKAVRNAIEEMDAAGMLNTGQFASELQIAGKANRSLNPGAGLRDGSRQWTPVAWSRKGGTHVENVLRGSLAYHLWQTTPDATRAARINQATDAIAKFHFDYGDLSNFEQVARRVIPFWTFMARNIPLQFEMLTHRPQKILAYLRLQENLRATEAENPFLPGYYDELNAAPIGGNVFFAPDLPFSDLISLPSMAKDPLRLLTQSTPLLKTPIELATERDLFTNKDMSDSKVSLYGFEVDEKYASALEDAIPLLGRARRLVPSDEKYQERVVTSWMSFFGIPVRKLTESEMLGEYRRQQYEANKAKRDPAKSERYRNRKRQQDTAEMDAILRRAGVTP